MGRVERINVATCAFEGSITKRQSTRTLDKAGALGTPKRIFLVTNEVEVERPGVTSELHLDARTLAYSLRGCIKWIPPAGQAVCTVVCEDDRRAFSRVGNSSIETGVVASRGATIEREIDTRIDVSEAFASDTVSWTADLRSEVLKEVVSGRWKAERTNIALSVSWIPKLPTLEIVGVAIVLNGIYAVCEDDLARSRRALLFTEEVLVFRA